MELLGFLWHEIDSKARKIERNKSSLAEGSRFKNATRYTIQYGIEFETLRIYTK